MLLGAACNGTVI